MKIIAVVHLARASNSKACLSDFLNSYRTNPAGTEHRLIIAMKGYDGRSARFQEDRALVHDSGGEALTLSRDDRFDIGAYQEVIRRSSASHFCFLNSFSRILVPGWLNMLDRALQQPRMGIAGASGSWQSPPYSEWLRLRKGEGLSHGLRSLWLLPSFPLFPNPHLRTNAFFISRATLRRINFPRYWTKRSMWKFESGRNGMTAQVHRCGLRTCVVTRAGMVQVEHWPDSAGYLSEGQEALLIADNQTDYYIGATGEEQRWLRRSCWGRA